MVSEVKIIFSIITVIWSSRRERRGGRIRRGRREGGGGEEQVCLFHATFLSIPDHMMYITTEWISSVLLNQTWDF